MIQAQRPFLKWAGGKRGLLKHILPQLTSGKRLIEPFVGSGAVFLNTQYQNYLLADSNNDLISLYLTLQKQGKRFINYVEKLFVSENNQKNKFYEFRELFNNTDDIKLKSALFVYLNRHGYNGLCRYNADGVFNVPFGLYPKPFFPKIALELFYQKSKTAKFITADFVTTMRQAKKNDIVYCDPPYVPLSKTAHFTNYGAKHFSELEQIKLAQEAEKLADKGITILISNHATEFTFELYNKASNIITFDAARMISSKAAQRKPTKELLAIYNKN